MHVGAAERLVIGDLARGHLDQRRTAEEHLGTVAHHHDVVAHARDVRTSRGRVAEDQGQCRQPRCAVLCQVVEQLSAGHEDLCLCGQVGAARLDDVDDGQSVLPRDGHAAEHLAEGIRVRCAAADGGVVGDDHRLDALDHADAYHHATADGELTAPGGEGA